MKVKRGKNKITYTFKKGEQLSLDSIYDIQGLLPFDWYIQSDAIGVDEGWGKESGDEVTIKQDLTIEISWKKSVNSSGGNQ